MVKHIVLIYLSVSAQTTFIVDISKYCLPKRYIKNVNTDLLCNHVVWAEFPSLPDLQFFTFSYISSSSKSFLKPLLNKPIRYLQKKYKIRHFSLLKINEIEIIMLVYNLKLHNQDVDEKHLSSISQTKITEDTDFNEIESS